MQIPAATCPVCQENARIRQILCFPLLSSEQMLQALVMTDATSFQLLRSILEPDVRNQHAIELTEKFSFNEKFNFSQIFNREMDINFQPDFLKTSMNVMRDYQMKMKHHKCRELASIAVKVFDPRTVNLPDDNSVKLNLQKCALEIIQQTEEVMDELSFVEEHLNVLSETTPEIYVAYLPPHNFRKDPGNCPMQRSFWQHKHHAFSNRRRAARNTIYEKNERNSVHCEGSYIFNQCDQLHYLPSSICDCISLKVFGSDTGQVLTYYFHPPIDDCNHRDQFHLMRLVLHLITVWRHIGMSCAELYHVMLTRWRESLDQTGTYALLAEAIIW